MISTLTDMGGMRDAGVMGRQHRRRHRRIYGDRYARDRVSPCQPYWHHSVVNTGVVFSGTRWRSCDTTVANGRTNGRTNVLTQVNDINATEKDLVPSRTLYNLLILTGTVTGWGCR